MIASDFYNIGGECRGFIKSCKKIKSKFIIRFLSI